jgi:hypothetical protein
VNTIYFIAKCIESILLVIGMKYFLMSLLGYFVKLLAEFVGNDGYYLANSSTIASILLDGKFHLEWCHYIEAFIWYMMFFLYKKVVLKMVIQFNYAIMIF